MLEITPMEKLQLFVYIQQYVFIGSTAAKIIGGAVSAHEELQRVAL
jgi:hypothetical protein